MVLKQTAGLVLLGGALLALTGCPAVAPSRTENQGGGSLVTAGAKIANGKISSLTPDEIQIVTDKAVELKPDLNVPELTDEQAAAVVEFFDANDLNTLDDVVNLIDEAEQDPSAVVIPDSVITTLEGLLTS